MNTTLEIYANCLEAADAKVAVVAESLDVWVTFECVEGFGANTKFIYSTRPIKVN